MFKMNQSQFTDLVSYMYEVLEHVEVFNEYNVAVAYLLPKQLILAIPRLFNCKDIVVQVVWPINGFVLFKSSSGVQLLRAYRTSKVCFSGESPHKACAQKNNFTKFSKDRIDLNQQPVSFNANNRMCGDTTYYPMWRKNDTKNSLASKHESYYSNLTQSTPFQHDGESHGRCSYNNPKRPKYIKTNQGYLTVTDCSPFSDPSSTGNLFCDHFVPTNRNAQFSESEWQRIHPQQYEVNNNLSHQNRKIKDTNGSSNKGVVMTDEEVRKQGECVRLSNGVAMKHYEQSIYQNAQRSRENEKNTNEENNKRVAHKRDATRLQLAKSCLGRKEWRNEKDRWTTVSALCYTLEKMCMMNDKNGKSTDLEDKSEFHAETVPAISLAAYLERIAWHFDCSTQCFVLALEYMIRLEKCKGTLKVNKNTVHQLVATCLKISTKYFDDKVFNNSFYAHIAGLSAAVINAFEVRLLFYLKFDLFIEPDQYQKRYKMMLSYNDGPNAVIISPAGNCNSEGEVRSSTESSHAIS